MDLVLQWAGDRLNPILVKETRQALKSRQFTITFALLLLCGWVWSLLGVAITGPDIWYGASGVEMFFGYYVILAFPLLVIVPFGAFRSLAGEQEDRTYELMSITTLGPRQIIRGKLGSAVLQMLIYLSAVTPCLAFSYLLRGIDLPTILFILFYTILGSLGLATIGLLAGTITSEKHWQVVLSVFLIGGLLYGFGGALALVAMALDELSGGDMSVALAEPEFWQANAAILTAYGSYLALLFYAGAAQITFASDNRSSRLRVVMLVQQGLLTGWMAWLWFRIDMREKGILFVFMILIGLHWYVMGALMTGESPELSLRVKRQLPQSFLGRVFFTWLAPGPGTGYILAVSSLVGALATVAITVSLVELFPPRGVVPPSLGGPTFGMWSTGDAEEVLTFGVLGISYVAFYLGLGLLLIRLLRLFAQVRVLSAVLIQGLVVLVMVFIPTIIHLMTPSMRNVDYSLLHALSPYSIVYLADRPGLPEASILLVMVPCVTLVVFLLNLPGVAREVRQVRIAKPRRVAEEDAQIAAARTPAEPIHTSPWD